MIGKSKKIAFYDYLLVSIFLMAAWEALSLWLSKPFLPGPAASGKALFEAFGQDLSGHLLASAIRVLVSLVAATLPAVPLGMLLGRSKKLDRLAAPVIYLTYPLPKIIFLPVILTLFGVGNLSKIFLISIIVFFQVLVTTRDAARQVNRSVVDSVVSLGANEWQVYRHVIYPACLPKILTALRIGLGTAIAVLFFSETIANQVGIGYYLMDAWGRFAWEEMFAGIIAMGAMGFAFYLLLDWMEKKLCPWQHRS